MIVSLHPRITSLLIPMVSPFCQGLEQSSVVLRQTYYDRRSISDRLNVLRQTKYVKRKRADRRIHVHALCPQKTKTGWMCLAGGADRTQTEQKTIRQDSYFQVKNRDCSNHIDENILKFYNKLLFRYTRIPEFV